MTPWRNFSRFPISHCNARAESNNSFIATNHMWISLIDKFVDLRKTKFQRAQCDIYTFIDCFGGIVFLNVQIHFYVHQKMLTHLKLLLLSNQQSKDIQSKIIENICNCFPSDSINHFNNVSDVVICQVVSISKALWLFYQSQFSVKYQKGRSCVSGQDLGRWNNNALT